MILALGLLLTAESGGEAIPGLALLSQTVLGLMIILALFGWVWFKPSVEELKDRASRAEAQRDGLIKTYEDEIIPVLREVSNQVLPVLSEAKEILNKFHTELEIRDRTDRR